MSPTDRQAIINLQQRAKLPSLLLAMIEEYDAMLQTLLNEYDQAAVDLEKLAEKLTVHGRAARDAQDALVEISAGLEELSLSPKGRKNVAALLEQVAQLSCRLSSVSEDGS